MHYEVKWILEYFSFNQSKEKLWPNAGIINSRPGLDGGDPTTEDAEDEEENDDI